MRSGVASKVALRSRAGRHRRPGQRARLELPGRAPGGERALHLRRSHAPARCRGPPAEARATRPPGARLRLRRQIDAHRSEPRAPRAGSVCGPREIARADERRARPRRTLAPARRSECVVSSKGTARPRPRAIRRPPASAARAYRRAPGRATGRSGSPSSTPSPDGRRCPTSGASCASSPAAFSRSGVDPSTVACPCASSLRPGQLATPRVSVERAALAVRLGVDGAGAERRERSGKPERRAR